MTQSTLFQPLELPALRVPNRVVMAPMTRSRADFQGNVSPLAADYYGQRASAGLIVTEAVAVNTQAHGYPFTPGIWSEEQAADWKAVVERVHFRGGRICAQLWHVGRVGAAENNPAGLGPVGPSAVAADSVIFTKSGRHPLGVPRALTTEEVRATIEDFATAAERALKAGFDMVELHGANGYLIEQFLSDEANLRTDAYGGSLSARLRFLDELLSLTAERLGDLRRIGLRLSPHGDFNGIRHSDPEGLYAAVLGLLKGRSLGYLHIVEANVSGSDSRRAGDDTMAPDVLAIARAGFDGILVACGEYDADRAAQTLAAGRADLVAFGRPYISNPDLVERMAQGTALAAYDRSTFYTRGAAGYTDYPSASALADH
ncbi:alkene reductase [Paracoccus sp. S-4012]|uniref:alkene reductase n=1 Tax=Paracoccus sp. S-4012 TaxID=2665648 RepID=UPI0012AFD2A8|nr:alkene reductase [Paracoccus sp. S-4012]MRX48885.1 alkene reductase [Paracoccus sp. S-4012]